MSVRTHLLPLVMLLLGLVIIIIGAGLAGRQDSIGGIVALLTWIYLSSYIFLFGAELNSEVEHQTARNTTAGVDKPLGARGAWSADHVAAGATDEGKEKEQGDSARWAQKKRSRRAARAIASAIRRSCPPSRDRR